MFYVSSQVQDQAIEVYELGNVEALNGGVSSCQGCLCLNIAQQRTKSFRATAIMAIFLRVFCPPQIR
jgi:hypothetical protein